MVKASRPAGRLVAAALLLAVPAVARAADPGAADQGVVQPRAGFRDALTAPLEDLNLKKTDIPDVLRRAQAAPYATTGLDHCEAVAAEIGRLDGVLGPDLEEVPPPDTRSGAARTASQAHDVGVEVAQDRAHSLIPFRGLIRKLTGAERNSRRMQAAVRAGDVRRGYLKGVGMRMNCAPPAAPPWFVPAKPIEAAVVKAAPPQSLWDRLLARLVYWLHRLGIG